MQVSFIAVASSLLSFTNENSPLALYMTVCICTFVRCMSVEYVRRWSAQRIGSIYTLQVVTLTELFLNYVDVLARGRKYLVNT